MPFRAMRAVGAVDFDDESFHNGRFQEAARYLRIAVNSASELEYHLIAGRDIGCISKADFLSLLSQLIEVRKMLYGLLNHLRAGSGSRSRR